MRENERKRRNVFALLLLFELTDIDPLLGS